jgi:hypothetical protein
MIYLDKIFIKINIDMDTKILYLDGALVVEFNDLTELPRPKDVEFFIEPAYDLPDFNKNGKRWTGKCTNYNEIHDYFKWLILEQAYPNMFDRWEIKEEYPFTLDFLRKNSNVAVTLLKDEAGWQQPIHNDNRSYIMAGAFHLEDSIGGGTSIYGSKGDNKEIKPEVLYQAPSNKNSGAAWLNTYHAWHSIGPCPADRLFYLLHVRWNIF